MTNSPATYPGNQMTFSDPGESKTQLQTGKPFENSAANKPERKRKKEKENSATMHEEGGVLKDSLQDPEMKISPLGCRISADHSFSLSMSLFFSPKSLTHTSTHTPSPDSG